MTPKTITTSAAAQITGHTIRAIARLARTGKIPGARLMGRQWYIPTAWAQNPANANPGKGRPTND
jgi:hypothetical protein